LHFSQYGAIEATDIMKDRLSGKSRGFGFVTFVDPAAAARALQMEHTIDGRRCEAKVALPKVILDTQEVSNDLQQQQCISSTLGCARLDAASPAAAAAVFIMLASCLDCGAVLQLVLALSALENSMF
jgi:RNA recognition motif-containing protein